MRPVLWIPIGAIALGIIVGAMLGSRSRSSSARSGALIGLCLAGMTTLPLLAIGLATT